MTVKLLTEHHLEFLSLQGGCTGSCESTLVKMLQCWKSNVAAIFPGSHDHQEDDPAYAVVYLQPFGL